MKMKEFQEREIKPVNTPHPALPEGEGLGGDPGRSIECEDSFGSWKI